MANISKVYLLDTPLEDDMKHTLFFNNASAQHSYMSNNVIRSYTNVSYQRDTSTFRCPTHIDSIRQCNYMMYQNSAYSNKWFYCFIEKMTYISDGLTDVEFKVDPIQTFMFDFETQPSFIEREHTNNDSVGNNTVPEDLELGDYIKASNTIKAFTTSSVAYAIACTKLIDRISSKGTAINLGTVPDGFTYIAGQSVSDVKTIVRMFNDDGHGDYINSIFVVPSSCFQNYVHITGDYDVHVGYTYQPAYEDQTSFSTPSTLAGNYSPRNNKLKTYPFRYLQMSNLNGSVANYHYEYFENGPNFEIKGYASPGCDAKVYPRYYKGITYNYDEGLSFVKLPVGGWTSDVYTNWLTQNGVNIATGFVADVVSIGAGIATSPAGGGIAIAKGATSIADKLGQIYQHSMQPPQAEGATNIGSASYRWGYSCMQFKHMSIRPEFARICDDFFDMYGYATNRVKKPNYNHRQNWWYTKTIDIYIKGNIPNEYMNEIKSAYNNGITYWRNPANFMNYSVSNAIV